MEMSKGLMSVFPEMFVACYKVRDDGCSRYKFLECAKEMWDIFEKKSDEEITDIYIESIERLVRELED